MKHLETIVKGMESNWVIATQRFRRELMEMNLTDSERSNLLAVFVKEYEKSEDYDIAAMKVLQKVFFARKSSDFKKFWKDFQKQKKGDKVLWEGKKYNVEDVRLNERDGKNVYTICRVESDDGTSVKLVCHKILATEGELEHA